MALYVYVQPQVSIIPNTFLITMVKNERHALPRMLQSVQKHLMDPSWVMVCDTGSTDGTWEWLQQQKNMLKVQHPWVDFATNRNACLKTAVQYIENQAQDKASRYRILFLDADHQVVMHQSIDTTPVEHLGMVAIGGGTLRNYLPYWMSFEAAKRCLYKGVTHEFLDCPASLSNKTHVTLFHVLHHADGGNRATKFTRDYQLLSRAVRNTTITPSMQRRYAFYLARTLDDLNRCGEAIPWYEQRARWGGWIEEAFYAQYAMAKCMIQLGNYTHEAVEEALLQATRMLPYRVEPYYQLAKMHRNQNQMPQCVRWCTEATWRLTQRNPDALFLEQDIYGWKLQDELALCLFYTNNKELAHILWAHVLHDKSIPPEQRTRIQQNLIY